jgi:uncharacterized LabA/DUF88 family protein
MGRVAFFIDGFNVYHALKEDWAWSRYKWLDYRKLAECFINPKDKVVRLFYFTAYPLDAPEKEARHRLYVKALESVGIITIEGEYKKRDRNCPLCGGSYKGYEEKMTDVNIASTLLREGMNGTADIYVLMSGDNDLAPAVETFREFWPDHPIVTVLPIGTRGSRATRLRSKATYARRMKLKHLKTSRFPDSITTADGSKLECPELWRLPTL